MTDNRETRLWLVLFILYILATFAMSMIPGSAIKLKLWGFGIDWVLHIVEYALLAWLVLRYLQIRNSAYKLISAGWITILICFAVGGFNEILQVYTPGRYPSITDQIANTAGAMITVWLVRRRYRKQNISIPQE